MCNSRYTRVIFSVLLLVMTISSIQCETNLIPNRISNIIKQIKKTGDAPLLPPQLPTSFKALFKDNTPFGSIQGIQYYDLENSRVRVDTKTDNGPSISSIAFYNERVLYDVNSMTGCSQRQLHDTMPIFVIPPFATFVGYEVVNSKNGERWRADDSKTITDFWVHSVVSEGKTTYLPAKIWVRTNVTFPLDYKIEFDHVETTYPLDSSIFSIWKKAGCEAPNKPNNFTVRGYTRNALSGQVIGGISFIATINEKDSRKVISDKFGVFTIENVPSQSNLKLSSSQVTEYLPFVRNLTNIQGNIHPGTVADLNISPTLQNLQYRAVLNWGSYPLDLDSHLIMKDCETNYTNKVCNEWSGYAKLERDVVSGYGPESTTLTLVSTGKDLK